MTAVDQPQGKFNSWLANHPSWGIVVTAVGYALMCIVEMVPAGKVIPPLLLFSGLGVVALVLMPYVLGLPSGRKSLAEYSRDIRLWPMQPIGRNVAIGLLLALLMLGGILLASFLTGHFISDATKVPPLRWVKGLTRGIWEEVFFRGIVLVLFMRLYPRRKAVCLSAFVFAMMHFRVPTPKEGLAEIIVDLISLFFIGLFFTYVVLKTGSLLAAMVCHYVYDIFVIWAQQTPGADKVVQQSLLFGLLWGALILGAILTKLIVGRWPNERSAAT
jgi:membrane protease YdiL (CAAX protease family)